MRVTIRHLGILAGLLVAATACSSSPTTESAAPAGYSTSDGALSSDSTAPPSPETFSADGDTTGRGPGGTIGGT